jgi:hypothetical protein
MTMRKLIKNGKVAVLYSPDFGAGWYTWNQDHPEILFDPAMVKLVEKGQYDELATYVELKYPGIFTGGLLQLQVEWIEEGKQFRVVEYDGSESIEVQDDIDWMIA